MCGVCVCAAYAIPKMQYLSRVFHAFFFSIFLLCLWNKICNSPYSWCLHLGCIEKINKKKKKKKKELTTQTRIKQDVSNEKFWKSLLRMNEESSRKLCNAIDKETTTQSVCSQYGFGINGNRLIERWRNATKCRQQTRKNPNLSKHKMFTKSLP